MTPEPGDTSDAVQQGATPGRAEADDDLQDKPDEREDASGSLGRADDSVSSVGAPARLLPSSAASESNGAAPEGWSVKHLQRVGPQPGGREAVERHVTDNIAIVVNGNDPLMVTKTWDGKHTNYSLMPLPRALGGLKRHAIELDPRLAQLELARREATVAQLEQGDARATKRELKKERRALEQARERLAATETTVYDVVHRIQSTLTYDNLVFRPGNDARPDDFNLFRGYAAERLLEAYPDRYPEAVQPVLDNIKDVLCAGDERVYAFALKYLAHILQNPTDKCGVALLFYSVPGAGKGVLFGLLQLVIGGTHVTVVQDNQSLTGEFNAHRANKLLILANELKNGGVACKEANVLKSMITDKTDHIRCLGKDRRQIDSVSSLMMFTNERRAVRIDPDDRRYCAIESSAARAKDVKYFNPLYAAIENPQAQVEFFRQMREINIDGFHFGSNIPQTSYRDELQRADRRQDNTPVVHRYLAAGEWTDEQLRFSADDLVDKVKEWMQTNGGADSLTAIAAGKQLNSLGFSATQTKINGHNIRLYDLGSRAKVLEALQRQGVTAAQP